MKQKKIVKKLKLKDNVKGFLILSFIWIMIITTLIVYSDKIEKIENDEIAQVHFNY